DRLAHLYSPADLPVLNRLARFYGVSDEWFSSVPTQTNANRAFSLSGTSCGLVNNGFLASGDINKETEVDWFDTRTIWNVLAESGKSSWSIVYNEHYPGYPKNYHGEDPLTHFYTYLIFPQLQNIPSVTEHFQTIDQFLAHAKAGTLKRFTYL